MNVESKLWKVVSRNDAYAHITQKASGTIRTVSRGTLPSVERIAAMSERQFDSLCREAFHSAATR
jgi:hypothetical protein